MPKGKKKSFQDMAKERYDELDSEIEKLELELKSLKEEQKSIKAYLQAAGLIEKQTRAPRKKKAQKQADVKK